MTRKVNEKIVQRAIRAQATDKGRGGTWRDIAIQAYEENKPQILAEKLDRTQNVISQLQAALAYQQDVLEETQAELNALEAPEPESVGAEPVEDAS